MCGITGIFGTNDQHIIKKMTDSVTHRGPDEVGYFHDDRISLGHARLSIIDLHTGSQPMFNENKNFVVVYNGEIYNYQELKSELEKKGHNFSTSSDTEVIVHAYEEYGIESFNMFNGMFAFAIWDSKKKELILARDSHGIKPLYFSEVNKKLLFASEAKAILNSQDIEPEVNIESLYYMLNLRYIPYEQTIFKNIQRLAAGHFLRAKSNGQLEIRKYKRENTHNLLEITENQASTKLNNALLSSIKRHLISDVPLGFYLSGGIDSTTLVAISKELGHKKLTTFSMGFGEERDELQTAKQVSEYFETDHKEIIIDGGIMKEFPSMIWCAEGPKRNLWHYYLAKLARKHVKVVLSGLGCDEFFGGYDFRYKQIMNYTNDLSTQEKVKTYINTQGRDILSENEMNDFFGKQFKNFSKRSVSNLFIPFFNTNGSFLQQVVEADKEMKMTNEFLLVDDAVSMAHGLEVRVPFLDNELTSLSQQLPMNYKFHNNEGKFILKKTMTNRLPDFVLKKSKQGFNPDPVLVYKKELHEYAKQYLLDGIGISQGFFTKDFVTKLLSQETSDHFRTHYNKLWDIFAFETWYKLFIVRKEFTKPNISLDKLLMDS